MTTTDPTTTQPYGGYAVTNVRTAGGDETLRFEAVVTLHGQRVFSVSNGGEGGAHRYGGLGPHPDAASAERGWATSQAAIRAFEQYASGWNAGGPYAGYGDADQLVDRLITVARLNRMRRTPIALDGEDVWATGEFHAAPASMAREQVLEMLRSPAFAGRNPRIWDRERGDFVPVT